MFSSLYEADLVMHFFPFPFLNITCEEIRIMCSLVFPQQLDVQDFVDAAIVAVALDARIFVITAVAIAADVVVVVVVATQ